MQIILDEKYRIDNWFDWTGYNWENFAAGETVWQENNEGEVSYIFASVDFDARVVRLQSFS